MNENVEYLKMFALFPASFRKFMRHRLTLDNARETVHRRMRQREDNFLTLVERAVYGNPHSPYLPLLERIRCDAADLRALVKKRGVEGALSDLRAQGVYVTFEEFKGRKPIQRDGTTTPVRASDFDNPFSQRTFSYRTSGSTGTAVKIATDFDHVAARASNRIVTMAAHNLLGLPMAIWRGILPDRTMSIILFGALTGNLPERWFSPIGPRDSRYALKYGLGTYYLIMWMRILGARVPLPEYVKDDQALVVARWVTDTVKERGACLLRAGVSRAVRVCVAAQEAGLDLTGATIAGAGEPPTAAKVAQINRTGARFLPSYGMSEAGQPGSGCANPIDESDVHLFKDMCAIVPFPYRVEAFDVTVPAFNLTTLHPTAPKVMLNVQTDDYGIIEERHCGCELESYGYTTHLRQIRSYSKLTGGGVTLIGDELLHILEVVLPARFGGTPLDYQFMEQEDEQSFTRLYLIASPRIIIDDEDELVKCVMDALRNASPMADASRLIWQNAHTLQVKRMEPVWTERGKLLPLHIPRRSAGHSGQGGGK